MIIRRFALMCHISIHKVSEPWFTSGKFLHM